MNYNPHFLLLQNYFEGCSKLAQIKILPLYMVVELASWLHAIIMNTQMLVTILGMNMLSYLLTRLCKGKHFINSHLSSLSSSQALLIVGVIWRLGETGESF